MPFDWGTTLVDAGGAFHDIAKNAFDSLAVGQGKALTTGSKWLSANFDQTFNQLKGKAASYLGLDADKALNFEEIAQHSSKKVMGVIARFSSELAGGAVLSQLLVKAGLAAEGPVGILISEALTIGITEFTKAMGAGHHYEPGAWVLIDLGDRGPRINESHIVQARIRTDDFTGGQYIDLADDIDYIKVPHHAIGFIMGQNAPGTYFCFNIEIGKEVEYKEEHIRPVPKELAEQFDKSEEFSLIREVRFLKDHDPTMKSYLPTQPGETVIYRDEQFTIIKCLGEEYQLEDSRGRHLNVHATQLASGKTSSSASWDNRATKLGSFTSKSPDALAVGQWVWVTAGKMFMDQYTNATRRRMGAVVGHVQEPISISPDGKILALVESIQGKNVELVRAYDGETIIDEIEDISPVISAVADILDHDKDSAPFKQAVLDGKDTELTPLGEILPAITLGIGPPDLIQASDMHEHMIGSGLGPGSSDDTRVRIISSSAVADAGGLAALEATLEDTEEYDKQDNQYRAVNAYQTSSDGALPSSGGSLVILLAGAILFFAMNS